MVVVRSPREDLVYKKRGGSVASSGTGLTGDGLLAQVGYGQHGTELGFGPHLLSACSEAVIYMLY